MTAELSRALLAPIAAGRDTLELRPPFSDEPALASTCELVVADAGLPAGAAAPWVALAHRSAGALLVAAPRRTPPDIGGAGWRPAGWPEVEEALRTSFGDEVLVLVASPRRAWTLSAEDTALEGTAVTEDDFPGNPDSQLVIALAGDLDPGPLPRVLLTGVDDRERLSAAAHAAERRAETWEIQAIQMTRQKEGWEERHGRDVRAWMDRALEAERHQKAWEERAREAERQVEVLRERIRAAGAANPVRVARRMGATWAQELNDRT